MGSRLPLLVILGATGCGKTKLSLEIAKKFGGEVIGADSMQLYKGLDIVTAKATKEEQLIAPHHMIDILEPHETYTVIDYQSKALNIINNMLENNKLPVVVGGTNYYIESLLWKILIENDSNRNLKQGELPNNDHELPSEELHKKLKALDPAMARRLHPNHKRKIVRSLEVLYQKGRRHSEILAEQQATKGGSRSGGGLRYPNVVVLWLQCEQNALDKRLYDRVDDMIQQGLIDELMTFHRLYNEHRINSEGGEDYTRGVYQTIGFKEFRPYLILNDEQKQTSEGKTLLEKSLEQLRIGVRRYSIKQKRWILNRLLGRKDRQVPPLYGLDTTDVSKWNENVTTPAFEIVQHYISGEKCEYVPLEVREVSSVPNSEDDTHVCEICDRIFVGGHQWEQHLKSNRHKKRREKLGTRTGS